MAAGVQNSGFLILFLSEGVLERPFVQFELEEALRGKKTVLLVHEQDRTWGTRAVARIVRKDEVKCERRANCEKCEKGEKCEK